MNILINNQSTTLIPFFAVIDIETNWRNEVISIGVVIAHKETYHTITEKYYVITPECYRPAIYQAALDDYTPVITCKRENAISDLRSLLQEYCVKNIFAYSARFDYSHLPELNDFIWHDIICIAAYKQYNPSILECEECCSTGRLKSNFGAESIMRRLIKDESYFEKHNAMHDAKDELLIMQMIGYPVEKYPSMKKQ